MIHTNGRVVRSLCLLAVFLPGLLWAQRAPERTSPLQQKIFSHPHLFIGNDYKSVEDLPAEFAAEAVDHLSRLRLTPEQGKIDPRTGRWGTLFPTEPLLPGTGFGNNLSWSSLSTAAPASHHAYQTEAWDAFVSYVQANEQELGIDVHELIHMGNVEVHDDGALVQIHAKRQFDGIPVRDSHITAVINHGNLILFGTTNWGDIELNVNPSVPMGDGIATVLDYMNPIVGAEMDREAQLVIIPMSAGSDLSQLPLGKGLNYRLVWSIKPSTADVEGEMGSFEALIDAHSGELLAFNDIVHYFADTSKLQGGVYPVSNDGAAPDGVEVVYPMPFADLTNNGTTYFTDTGGNLLLCLDGTISTTLSGIYVTMNDTCGPVNESGPVGVLDLGTSAGTDCITPAGAASAGNTHATRTGFYELNKIIEMARSQLPNNSWLQSQLTANMNIALTCNATWGGSVNFYQSGGGCFNTGEIAGVFDHEWGHGMDNNDVTGAIQSPGEAIADVYAALRLNVSCIGRGFTGGNCGGYGDPCLNCTGVRDIDFGAHASGLPRTHATAANCPPPNGGVGPCGLTTHCEGGTVAETVWDLWKRDLPTIYGLDDNTAHEIVARLTYLGSALVVNAYTCTGAGGSGDGCNADGYYLNTLAADDDNGNLNDGTPHMAAIDSAFSRHTIHCPTPIVQDGGCAGLPADPTALNAVARDRGAELTWTAVAGANSYFIYRTEGVNGCGFGKVRLGETADLFWSDNGLMNGMDYYYIVIPAINSFCLGNASNCEQVTPMDGGNFSFADNADFQIMSGDGDVFVDNCEDVDLTFNLLNIGNSAQANVRIIGASSPSHPDVEFNSAFPVMVTNNLLTCDSTNGTVSFTAEGLAHNDTLVIKVDVTSDGLSPGFRTGTFSISGTESDGQFFATLTWDFEGGDDGWTPITGTFFRTDANPAAQGTSFYFASSANLDNQCDQVRSPDFVLAPTSTLSLWNQFGIEPFAAGPGVWYDRANVGLTDNATGLRKSVDPDGGRLYNAGGPNGNCGTGGQNAWADVMNTWAESTFSAAALDTATIAGNVTNLEIRYGTDGGSSNFGFWFDQVTLTDVTLPIADTQSDFCDPCFLDLTLWGNTDPLLRQSIVTYVPHVTNLGTWPPPAMVQCPPVQ